MTQWDGSRTRWEELSSTAILAQPNKRSCGSQIKLARDVFRWLHCKLSVGREDSQFCPSARPRLAIDSLSLNPSLLVSFIPSFHAKIAVLDNNPYDCLATASTALSKARSCRSRMRSAECRQNCSAMSPWNSDRLWKMVAPELCRYCRTCPDQSLYNASLDVR